MHFHDVGYTKAEIIWTLKSVSGGFSVRANDDLNKTLSVMFSDRKIARHFNRQEAKPSTTA